MGNPPIEESFVLLIPKNMCSTWIQRERGHISKDKVIRIVSKTDGRADSVKTFLKPFLTLTSSRLHSWPRCLHQELFCFVFYSFCFVSLFELLASDLNHGFIIKIYHPQLGFSVDLLPQNAVFQNFVAPVDLYSKPIHLMMVGH